MRGLHKYIVIDIVTAALVGIVVVGTGRVAGAGVIIDMTTTVIVTEVIATRIVYGVLAAAIVISVAFGTASTVATVVVISSVAVKEKQQVC